MLEKPASAVLPALALKRRPRIDYYPYLLLAPALIVLTIVMLYPILVTVQLVVTDEWLMKSGSRFVGLENLVSLAQDPRFGAAVVRSIVWTLGSMVPSFVIGLALALLVNRPFRGKELVRGLLLVPWVIPPIVIGLIWRWIFDEFYGLYNYYLLALGLITEPMTILGDINHAMAGVILASNWMSIPFPFITCLAGLQAISTEYYEAAKADGANPWQLFWNVTWPLLRPIVSVTLILMFIWTFNSFDLVWALTRGGPKDATQILSLEAYRVTFQEGKLSYGATISVAMLLILLVVATVYVRRFYPREEEY